MFVACTSARIVPTTCTWPAKGAAAPSAPSSSVLNRARNPWLSAASAALNTKPSPPSPSPSSSLSPCLTALPNTFPSRPFRAGNLTFVPCERVHAEQHDTAVVVLFPQRQSIFYSSRNISCVTGKPAQRQREQAAPGTTNRVSTHAPPCVRRSLVCWSPPPCSP